MSENRAADYIAFGLNRGVDRFMEGLEKRKEEEKNRAREFKSLVEFNDANGWLSKDQSTTMDLDALKGFTRSKMYNDQLAIHNQELALRRFEEQRRAMADANLTGAIMEYNNQQGRGMIQGADNNYFQPAMGDSGTYYQPYSGQEAASPLDAFNAAMAKYPGAGTDERFGAFANMVHQQMPKEYAPTDVQQLMEFQDKLKKAGEKDKASVVGAIIDSKTHPAREDRFDLDYSNQMKMQNELNFLHEEFTNPLMSMDADKEAKSKKLTLRQLYEQRLDAIDAKYKKLVRKPHAPEAPPVPAPAPEEKAAEQAPVKITSQADFDALPEGALFINPADGKVLKKKTK